MTDVPVSDAPASEAPLRAAEVASAQTRTVQVLVGSQALGGLGTTIGIAVASVLAERITGNASLAGLVQTVQVLGSAGAAYLLARVMGRHGRRPGVALGYLLGAVGAGLCVVGGAVGSFALLLTGALLLGANTAASLASRYAAADLAPARSKGRALSLVLWATTVGAVAGPNLVGPAGDLASAVGLPVLTGPFLVSLVATLAASLVVAALLRPDPLLLAREVSGEDLHGPPARLSRTERRELLRAHPGIGAAVLAMASAHAVMVAVMVMTPLHMDHGGADLEVIGLVISIHVLGMFFLSPLVGALVDRVGPRAVLGLGAGVLWASLTLSGTAPEGASLRIGTGLFLLGLGWSLCTVAAAALLTLTAPLAHRTGVQGTADLLMNLAAAAAGVGGGLVVGLLGYGALNAFAAVLVLGVAGAAVGAGPRSAAGERADAL
ncbi:MFS transporter [Nocardioides sp. HDW12B]|uniref:MFS transporter n=1 Tax=Nocardioides sp. HDW12B TaxID=2714939 RepID=UPI001F0FA0A8|nr:MFS transporter [Nocardioides sp. HDW12B]